MRLPMLRPQLADLANHPRLVGDPRLSGRETADRARRSTVAAVLVANATGAVVVASFALWALPKPEDVNADDAIAVNVVAAIAYLVLALLAGAVWGRRRLEGGTDGVRAWVEAERPPGRAEIRHVLEAPLRIMTVEGVLWGAAVVLFAAINSVYDPLLALGVGVTVALGGATTSTVAFLLCELALRPIASLALSEASEEDRGRVPGVATRWLLVWALGTGVPVVGIVLVGIVALTSIDLAETTLAVTMIALGGIGLVFGAVAAFLAAFATTHPIRSIANGLRRVRQGDLDVVVPVWDTTEMGLLQAGFNDMVAGLRERERIRDLFGRQVGEEVVEHALSDEIRLGGEVREVTVLFVDIAGSTTLAVERAPEEVVSLLNRFFGVVVEVVEECGGWINKFEGDAALAIFGAPIDLDDAPRCALKAARTLHKRLCDEVPELRAGIGVASGRAVAGNIGAEHRFEYTVIGDPVNEAARLTDLAKSRHPPVLASALTVEAAGDEAEHWKACGEDTLGGRARPTRLACPHQ